MITVPTRLVPSRGRRRVVPAAFAVTVVLTLGACGDGDDSADDAGATVAPSETTVQTSDAATATTAADDEVATETTMADDEVATETTMADDALGEADAFEPGAEIFRVVNLTAEPTDIYVRTTGLLEGFEIQPGLAPGETTEYFAPPQDGSVIVTTAEAGDPTCVSGCDHIIADISVWDDTGDTFTVLLHDADGEPEAYDFWEETGANTESANAMVAADPSTGQFVAVAVDVADSRFGMRLGLSDVDGCVEPINLNGGILVGGNQTPAYVYDGDSTEVYLYDNLDDTCTGEPVGGPFAITGEPGTRTFLFLTGTPGDLDAIVLPFGRDEGVDANNGLADGEPTIVDGDDPVEMLTQQFQNEFGFAADEASCLAQFLVEELSDLTEVENGELVELPTTPENQERLRIALDDGVVMCGIDTGNG